MASNRKTRRDDDTRSLKERCQMFELQLLISETGRPPDPSAAHCPLRIRSRPSYTHVHNHPPPLIFYLNFLCHPFVSLLHQCCWCCCSSFPCLHLFPKLLNQTKTLFLSKKLLRSLTPTLISNRPTTPAALISRFHCLWLFFLCTLIMCGVVAQRVRRHTSPRDVTMKSGLELYHY